MTVQTKFFQIPINIDESQKWKRFSQKSRITSIKREKLFPLIFIDFDVNYCVLRGTVRGAA